jgi:hypothetical protein
MPKFLSPIDLTTFELRNAVFQNLASAPGSPKAGQFYYDTVGTKFRYWNNSAWVDVQASGITAVNGTAPIGCSTTTNVVTVSITAATGSVAGSMSATDKTKLDASTSANTVSTIVFRDTNGDFSARNITANQVTGLVSPVNPSDATTKSYVDAQSQGLNVKGSARAGTTVALPANTLTGNVLTASANAVLTAIDGITLVVGERLLVKNEATGANNGIYVVTSVGAVGAPWVLTRTTDTGVSADVTPGMFVFVAEGTTLDSTGWVLVTDAPITLNTTALTFEQFSGAGTYLAGNGLTLTGNSFAVTGTASRISVSGSGVDISASYVGQSSIVTLGTITTGTWTGTTIAVANGGTGTTTLASGGILMGAGTGAVTATAAGTANQVLVIPSGGGTPLFGQVNLAAAAAVTGFLAVANGGTGAGTFNSNGVLLGNTTSAVTSTTAGSAYNILRVPSGGGAPTFGAIDLTQSAAVINSLPVANGGTAGTTAATARSGIGAVGKYAVAVGNGSLTSITVNHNLATQDVQVTVYTNGSPFDIAYPDVQITDTNNVLLIFGVAPTSSQYRCVVVG